MSAIPPDAGPVPAGATLLGGPKPPQPTIHRTEFHSCSIGLFVELDADDVCKGFKLQITDPFDRHIYEASLDQDFMDTWREEINQFPKVGEVPEQIRQAREVPEHNRDGDAGARDEVRDRDLGELVDESI